MKYTYFRSTIVSIILMWLIVLSSACAGAPTVVQPGPQLLPGDVLGLQAGTARMVVEEALNGGGRVLAMGDSYLFMKPFPGSGWGFVPMNLRSLSVIESPSLGNFTSGSSLSSLVEALKRIGWKDIDPKLLPVTAGVVEKILEVASNHTTFLVLPVSTFQMPESYQGQVQ